MKWLGFVLGGGLSYWTHQNVLWAIFHFSLSWIYVLYHFMVYEIGVFPPLEPSSVLGIFR